MLRQEGVRPLPVEEEAEEAKLKGKSGEGGSGEVGRLPRWWEQRIAVSEEKEDTEKGREDRREEGKEEASWSGRRKKVKKTDDDLKMKNVKVGEGF